MKKTGLVLFLPLICIIAMGQQNHAESNELSIGLPVLFNKTTVANVFGPTRSMAWKWEGRYKATDNPYPS